MSTWKEGVACIADHCKSAVDVNHTGRLRWAIRYMQDSSSLQPSPSPAYAPHTAWPDYEASIAVSGEMGVVSVADEVEQVVGWMVGGAKVRWVWLTQLAIKTVQWM